MVHASFDACALHDDASAGCRVSATPSTSECFVDTDEVRLRESELRYSARIARTCAALDVELARAVWERVHRRQPFGASEGFKPARPSVIVPWGGTTILVLGPFGLRSQCTCIDHARARGLS